MSLAIDPETAVGALLEAYPEVEGALLEMALRSSFRPQPLIETLRRAGAVVHSSVQGPTHFTWFGK